jgi:hypothetical protein
VITNPALITFQVVVAVFRRSACFIICYRSSADHLGVGALALMLYSVLDFGLFLIGEAQTHPVCIEQTLSPAGIETRSTRPCELLLLGGTPSGRFSHLAPGLPCHRICAWLRNVGLGYEPSGPDGSCALICSQRPVPPCSNLSQEISSIPRQQDTQCFHSIFLS